MKTIKLTDKQFQELHTYIVDTCENIMDRSLEWADSDLSNEIIDNNEIVFTLRSILDGVSKWKHTIRKQVFLLTYLDYMKIAKIWCFMTYLTI